MKTSYSFKQKARPEELLVWHSLNTAERCRAKTEKIHSLMNIQPEFLQSLSFLIGLSHDLGKATKYFQDRLQDPEYKTAETNHAELSALITWDIVKQYANSSRFGQSLVHLLGVVSYLVVRKHHGAIGNAQSILEAEADNAVLRKQLDALDNEEISAIIKEGLVDYGLADSFDYHWDKQTILDLRNNTSKYWDDIDDYKGFQLAFLHKFLFSILISSDKGSIILHDRNVKLVQIQEGNVYAVDQYKERFSQESKLDMMREELYGQALRNTEQSFDHNLMSLNMPTGTGKTLTSLSVACKIKEKLKKQGPIIYCLPFTSIIDQNCQVFSEVIERNQGYPPDSSQLLKHHYLAEPDYQEKDEEWNPDKSRFLIETWESGLVVTTFVQFFDTLAGSGNRKLLKLHKLREAVIILDEIQAVPLRYWEFIRCVLKNLATEMRCHIILVTATLPLIFEPGEVKSLITEPQNYFQNVNRTILRLCHHEKLSLQSFYPKLAGIIDQYPGEDILIVMNTIKSASQVFTYLCDRKYARDYLFLSTYVTPKERSERLTRLKQHSDNPKIIVTTQLVEAGVDLDVGLVIRDFGPLDSINQVAGRCNRHWLRDKPGEVYIFRLMDEKGRDYAYMVYDHALLTATEECFSDKEEIYEGDYWQISKRYFEKLKLKRTEADIKLIRCMEKLEHDEVSRKFSLIEEQPKQPIFVQLDKRAEKLWNRYLDMILQKKSWERKQAFNEFKNEFLEYVINVKKNDLNDLLIIEDFYLVPKAQLKQYYDLETGFIKGAKDNE